MKAKTCPSCKLRSYSAGATPWEWAPPWECPYCGTDMDDVPDEAIARLVPRVYPEEADSDACPNYQGAKRVDCEFCGLGSAIKAEYDVNAWAWVVGDSLSIELDDGNYSECSFAIEYCPKCGKMLEEADDGQTTDQTDVGDTDI